jgi:hypothetical protein
MGSNVPEQATIHGNLDIEYLMAVAPNVPTLFYANAQGSDFWSDLSDVTVYKIL